MYIPSFIKIGLGIKNFFLRGRDANADTQATR
jgi:hypothetical protein